jgi:hypothetical protein
VINPQNGHILCKAKVRGGGVTVANSFESDAVIAASRLRYRSRNCRNARAISDLPSCQLQNDTSRLVILCNIAHTSNKKASRCIFGTGLFLERPSKSEQCRSAILRLFCDHDI